MTNIAEMCDMAADVFRTGSQRIQLNILPFEQKDVMEYMIKNYPRVPYKMKVYWTKEKVSS